MRRFNPLRKKANINVQTADNRIIHIGTKVSIPIKPTGSRCDPVSTTFYVKEGDDHVVGHAALVGLEQLKLFDLKIRFQNGQVTVHHEETVIGQEIQSLKDAKCSLKVDERFERLQVDPNIGRLLKRFKGVFTDIGPDPIYGRPMRIYTTHNRPIYAKQRRYGHEEIIQMKQHVEELLSKGIIEPTSSGYSATSRVVPKKSGAGRLVVNYIPLNAVTLRDSYSLPNIQDIFDVIQGKKFFTTMDCAQGFYQILVDARDRHKTAFSTPMGNYQFVRCPFGARNSCAVFQAEMNRIFSGGLYTRCVIYVDDMLVFGSTKEEHDQNLEWVLSRCSKFNVKLKLEKCNFAQTEVDYLGFRVSGTMIKPQKARIDTLVKSKPPYSKTELRSLIGKLNFYSRFVRDYPKLLEPFRDLLKSNKDFQWKQHHQSAFEKILVSVGESPGQYLADRMTEKSVELMVMRDTLEAACIDQEGRLICRTGRLLSSTESNYSVIEKQLLALVMAIKRFRTWLDPERFVVQLPNRELEKVLSLVKRPERVERLLLAMPAGFDKFRFHTKESLDAKIQSQLVTHVPEEVYYIDGACKNNGKPDCMATWAVCAEFDSLLEETGFVDSSPSNNAAELTAAIKACEIAKKRGQKTITIVTDSRYLHSAATNWIDKWCSNKWLDNRNKPVVNEHLFKQLLIAKDGLEIEWIHVKGHSDVAGNVKADMLARSLLDTKTASICALWAGRQTIQVDDDEIESLKDDICSGRRVDLVVREDDKVYFVDPKINEGDPHRLYVPQKARKYLLDLAHDNQIYGGHLGIKKTGAKLMKFWWPRMSSDIEAYVKACDVCQRFKEPAGLTPGYLNSIPVSKLFEHVHIDIVGPITRTSRGNAYIITATDAFSKWTFAKPCQNIRTLETIKFLENNIIALHGRPSTIISDRGSQFTSKEWRDYLQKMDVKHNLTTPYHPQSNGIDERLNGTLVRILRAYVDEYQDDWDEHLKWAVFVYNTTVHSSTGYSPYQVLHGLNPRSPLLANSLEIRDHEHIDRIRESIRERANLANRRAQNSQKEYYDRHHSESHFEVGQLVLVRQHVAPLDLSKKFYPKWDGPAVITKIITDEQHIKTVEVYDCKFHTRKFVAVKDVKPYLKQSPDLQREKGDDAQHQSAKEPTQSDNFISFDDEEVEWPSLNQSFSLDLDTRTGPISSSPRRVTINPEVETLVYDSQPSFEDDCPNGLLNEVNAQAVTLHSS